jgi:hypothetical protein
LLPRVGLASGLPVGQHPTIGQRTWGVAADRTRWRGGIGARFRGWGIGSGGGGERKKKSTGTRGPRATKKTGREVARSGPGRVVQGAMVHYQGECIIYLYIHTHIYIYIYIKYG